MKFLCWNINKRYNNRLTLDTIIDYNVDFVFLQEMKLNSTLDIELTKLYKYKFYNCDDTDVIGYSNVNNFNKVDCNIPHSKYYIFVEFNNTKYFFVHIPMDEIKVMDIMMTFLDIESKYEKLIISGDLNFFDHEIDSQSRFKFFGNWFYYKLIKVNYIDAFREKYGNTLEYTWYSSKGNGQRIDHVLSKRFKIKEFKYYHKERINKISDHSSIIFEI